LDPNLEPLFKVEKNKRMPQKKKHIFVESKVDLKEKKRPKQKTPFRMFKH